MRMIFKVRAFIKRYYGEITISLGSVVVGIALSRMLDVAASGGSAERLIIGLLLGVLLLLTSLAILIRRAVISKVQLLEERTARMAGRGVPTQYDDRKLHFTEEKNRLVQYVVRTHLPEVVRDALDTTSTRDSRIACVVDSGTTFESFFPLIKLMGLGSGVDDAQLRRFQIYTNSLSGSDAFCRESTRTLTEHQLHLFGGTQIEKYRAVLGEVTLKAMGDLKSEYSGEKHTIIGLLTANWLLVGGNYDKLLLCSTERGHLDFKRKMAEIADTLIVVAPLGKILRLDTTSELNTFLRLEEEGKPLYDGFAIDASPQRTRENTFLVTTHRAWKDSVLYRHSEDLWAAYNGRKHHLYKMPVRCRHLELDHRLAKEDQKETEMPHAYLREHSWKVLHIE